ncbi:peroxisomal membrane protein PEX14 [Juglans microcarpa x Juglans regia]|uniref:peroxisomal membrane protein PEX14 n=1 Tax=Juglans microcarpa x Juglans regia TaxID=2249226 RepID=UPI001B7E0BD2|nr:peroxisomal membrane protein PEX14 [Juglans microcarpa x Juglans regia]XP_040986950.1 peroxisomal membrane protein PEX14 [Juglans microcarpa x Juglans regia]
MATQSGAPPNPTDGNTQNPELAQQTNQDQQESRAEAPKPSITPSVFVNSEPMREEQVQNAVKFLSHPKVRGSPVIYRRSFLEKKGLTKEEIDEAFRRVPDPQPSAQAGNVNQDGQVRSSSNNQPQAPVQALQPVVAAPTGAMGALMRYQFHWSHAVLAVGLLAVSGAGTAVLVKKAIVPRLKSWIRKIVSEEENDLAEKRDSKPSLAEEATAAAKAAAAAAADVAKASQEMLQSRNEERRYFEEFTNVLDVQVQEMKSMTNAIRKLEGQTSAQGRSSFVDQEDHKVTISSSQQRHVNGKADNDLHTVRSSSPPKTAEPSIAPHPKSYMDILAMIQRGERPTNIKEINDLPPNPNQQPSNPRLAPRAKPWEYSQAQNMSGQALQSQVNGEGLISNVQDNGINSQLNGDNSVPWWTRKNVKITEIENEDEVKAGSYTSQTSEKPVKRTWVPPQPPPVAMPEAAEAIRRPKSSVQKEQLADDQSIAHPSDVTDDLQRITKISESGGAVEINGGSSVLNSTEIQEHGNGFEQSEIGIESV